VIDGWVQREFGCKVQDLRQFSVTSLSRWLDQKPRAEKTTEEREPLSVRAKVKMLMEETLGQKIVDESRSFWELGGSSLQGMELVARLRRECGNSVGIASLMQDSSIDGIFSRVKGNGQVMPASFCKTLCVVGSPAKRGFHSATAGQEGLFVIWKQDPSATNYVVAGRVPHVAGLSSAEVERAVVNTVARHGALQTKRFLYAGAMLLQEVGAEVSWEWWGAVEREEEGWAGVRAVGRTAFNLESGEVGGVLRVRSWEGETWVVVHHILVDEWSMRVVEGELRAELRGEAVEAKTEVEDCFGFAEWEREVLEERGEELRAWWRAHLEGARAVRLEGEGGASASRGWRVGERQRSRVEEAARGAGVTQFAVWQGLFAVWAWKLCGGEEEKEDVLVVGPYGRREGSEYQRTVGYLLNMLVYRYRAASALLERGLKELARESGRVIAETIERGSMYPFARLLREASVERSWLLGNVMFSWVSANSELHVLVDSPKGDLFVYCDGLSVSLDASVDLRYAHSTWFGTESCEFEQSEDWSSCHGVLRPRLAHSFLRGLSSCLQQQHLLVSGEWFVGLVVSRSVLFVSSVLSLASSGTAFLAIDIEASPVVICSRLGSLNCKLAICGTSVVVALGDRFDLCIADVLGQEGPTRVSASDSASVYAVHTSGSTGNPKAVVISRRSLNSFMKWFDLCEWQLAANDVVFLSTLVSWDTSFLTTFWAKQSGCVCSVLSQGLERDGREFQRQIGVQKVSAMFLTPSQLLFVSCDFALRLLLVGGEALSRVALRHLKVEVWNVYGPTEATVVMTRFNCIRESAQSEHSTFPIGRPFSCMNLQMLNRSRALLRSGRGEGIIGGRQVGQGYANDRQSSKRSFVYDAFENDGLSPAYLTGDLVIFLRSKDAMYLGRRDEQVKVSGQRVELSAVEAAIRSFPSVDGCCVVAVSSGTGNQKRLVAFVSGLAEVAKLKAFLSRVLSAHEIPHQLFPVAKIPLSATGKVDKKALLSMLEQLSEGSSCASSVSTLQGLRECFELVTGVKSDDECNFFRMGGTSFMSMELSREIFRRFSVYVPSAKILKLQTADNLHPLIVENVSVATQPQTESFEDLPFASFSASVCQEGMFVDWKMELPPRCENTIVSAFHSSGPLEERDLLQSLKRMQARHSSLRARFVETPKGQVVVEPCEEEHQVLFFCDCPDVSLCLKQLSRVEFDLQNGPLFCVIVLNRSVLVLVIHHIIFDRGAEDIFLSNLLEEVSVLDAPSSSMVGFVEWEQEMLTSRGEELAAFWKNSLKNASMVEIPGVRACLDTEATSAKCKWPSSLAERVKRLCATNNWMQISFFHATLALLLLRLSASTSVTLSLAYSQRDHFQGVLGYLLNVLWVVYDEPAAGMDFCSFVAKCQSLVLEAFEHGAFPMPMIARVSGVGIGSEVTFGCDVLSSRVQGASFVPLDVQPVQLSRDTLQFFGDLELGGVSFNFRRANFAAFDGGVNLLQDWCSTIGRLMGGGSHNLQGQSQQVSSQIVEWNMSAALDMSLHHLISAEVIACLEARRWIIPATGTIGICIRRSKLFFWLTLSCIQRGTCFVPLNTEQAGCGIKARLAIAGARVVLLEAWRSDLSTSSLAVGAQCCRVHHAEKFAASDAAYVMFTSGSTGTPKGCVVLRQGLSNLASWLICHSNVPLVSSTDTFLFSCSTSFDPFVENLVVSRFARTLVLPEDWNGKWSNVVSKASVIDVTPTIFSFLLSQSTDSFVACKLIIFGGEVLSHLLARTVFRASRAATVWNTYGPTETTVFVSSLTLRPNRPTVSIGRPICNTALVVCDRRTLLIGGKSVGAGYKNLAARSRAAFVYDAQQGANDGSSRCYDSGDRARFGASGELEYEGRGDEQVKVSGQRVELGGVESAVLGCEGVRGCCVVVWKGGLVAFVVGRKDGVLEGVRRKVARHEVPHRVVEVEAIPLTTSGKADRAALLRSLEQQQQQQQLLVVEEKTRGVLQGEGKVRTVMERVLGRAVGSASASFWELGGTSLMAMNLDALLQETFGKRVGMAQLMRDGSSEGIAAWLELKEQTAEAECKSRGGRAGKGATIGRVTAGQEGLFVIWKQDPSATNYVVAGRVPHVAGLSSAEVERAVVNTVARHGALQTKRFLYAGAMLLQEVGAEVSWEWWGAVEREEEGWAGVRAVGRTAFNLESGEVGGVLRVRSWEGETWVVVHHILVDEWSMRVVEGELRAELRGEAVEAKTEVEDCFGFAEWEREVLEERGEELRAWWRAHLEGARAVRLEGEGGASASRGWRVGERQRSRVEEAARGAGVTQFAVWQGLFAVWAWKLCGGEEEKEDVLVVGPYGRREGSEYQRTVGYLLNMLVYRYRAASALLERGLKELARESGRVIAETIERGSMYPFARLVRESGRRELLGSSFVWMSAVDSEGELELEKTIGWTTVAKMGLQVYADGKSVWAVWDTRVREVIGDEVLLAEGVQSEIAQREEWGRHGTLGGKGTLQQDVLGWRRSVDGVELKRAWDGEVIGVHMERSGTLLAVLHGVAANGGAFLPLDSQYGGSVVEFRLEDAGVRCVVMDGWRNGICWEMAVAGELKRGRREAARLTASASGLAYLMYTSGSTGKPKGVAITQANVPNLLAWLRRDSGLAAASKNDALVWQSSISFDHVVTQVFWMRAGRVVAVRDGEEKDAKKLDKAMERSTIGFFVPSHLGVMLSGGMRRVAVVMLAGEAMSKELVLRWKSGSGGGVAEVWNLYGPTETTVDVCGGRADLREDRWAMVSIGRAFGGTLLRLGKGAGFGRLLIGGKSVGAGYKNLAARSRAAFVYDAQQGANDGSSQCYDSGDRARFGASGELEYEGRGDEQVKVSGQRVELGGVESAVLGCEGVRGCCVVVWKGGLVAFVVGRKDGVLEGVRRKVARHEVPHRVVEVEAIPLTTSGKADRAALLRSLEQQQCCPVSAVQDQLFAKVKRMVEDCLGVAELGESLLDRAFEGLGVSVDVIDGWVQREFGCKVQDLRQFSVTSLSRWLDQKPRAEKTTEEREPLSVRAKVKMLMEETLGQKIVDESRSFWELGGSSLQGMELVARLRRECGNSVGIASLMQEGTIDGILLSLASPETVESRLIDVSRFDCVCANRFGHNVDDILLYFCGYLTCAFDGRAFVESVQRKYRVITFSHVVDESPSGTARKLFQLLTPTERDHVRVVAGFSAGGVLAFEMAALFGQDVR
jgi:non-ribosomal peptide synthetase component F